MGCLWVGVSCVLLLLLLRDAREICEMIPIYIRPE